MMPPAWVFFNPDGTVNEEACRIFTKATSARAMFVGVGSSLAVAAMLLVLAVVLAGCASTKEPAPPPPLPPAKIVGDSYCSASGKQDWSPNDTPQTIDGIRRRNAGYAKRCEEGK